MAGKKKRMATNKQKANSSEKPSTAEGPSDEHCLQAEGITESTANGKCEHMKRSINAASVRKRLKNQCRISCETCEKLKCVEENSGAIWLCLFCGHKGCGRYSTHQHALKHTETSRSGPHHLAVSLDAFQIWCYQCDDEVMPSTPARNLLSDIKRSLKNAASEPASQLNEDYPTVSELAQKSLLPDKTHRGPKDRKRIDTDLPIKGLQNLGNTCFFNSVVQNVMQTRQLELLLFDGSLVEGASLTLDPNVRLSSNHVAHCDTAPCGSKESLPGVEDVKKYDPIEITLTSDYGPLTVCLRNLYEQFAKERASVVTPSALFEEVCRRAPRFRGFQQQDSHELLRYLLDSLRVDELKRRRRALLKKLGLSLNAESVSNTMTNCLKAYDRAANFTCVEQVFGGELVQGIKCLQCKNVSTRFESFLDLSLPIVDKVSYKNTVACVKHSQASNYSLKKAKKVARKQAKGNYANKHKSTKVCQQNKENLEDGSPKDSSEIKEFDASDSQEIELPTQLIDKLESFTLNDDPEMEQMESQSEQDATDVNTLVENTGLDDNGFYNNAEDESDSNSQSDHWSLYTEPLNKNATCLVTSGVCHVTSCLAAFMSTEILDGNNKFGCEHCNGRNVTKHGASQADRPKVYTVALKQYMIFSPPAVLTLHLKRFQQISGSLRKISKHVDFPLVLDISPFCCRAAKRKPVGSQSQILYSLYGVVSHSGRLSGGHYVAYVKLRAKSAGLNGFLQTLHTKNHSAALASVEKSLANLDCDTDSRRDSGENVDESQPPKNSHIKRSTDSSPDALTSRTSDAKAECKVPVNDRSVPQTWYYISDSFFDEVTESKVLSSEAYLLFYERIA